MTEINQFIINSQHKLADIASSIVNEECKDLEIGILLSNFLEELNCDYYNLTEDETLVIVHHLNQLAELSSIPLLPIVGYGTIINIPDIYYSGGNSNTGEVPAVHTHSISEVIGLQSALNNRYTKSETNTILQQALDDRDWKEAVTNYVDLETTYPNPEEGWAVVVKSEGIIYRYNGTAWVDIGSAVNAPLATPEVDGLMSKEDKTKLDALGEEVKYTFSIPVSLSGGKTLGKYTTGQTASFVEKTLQQIITDIGQEALEPTVSINVGIGQQEYNALNVNPSVTWDYTINTLGATLANFKLERSRDGNTWAEIYNQATQPIEPYNTDIFNTVTPDNSTIQYKVTITDSAGASKSSIASVTFKAYQQPTISFSIGSTTRERGDKSTSITGTITRNSPNVLLTNYQLQYSVNGGSWTNIGSTVVLSGSSQVITPVIHNDASVLNADTVAYRFVVVDAQQTTNSNSQGITFVYPRFFGYRTSAPTTIAQIEALGNKELSDSKVRTVNGVTATGGNLTMMWYRADAGNITSVIMDGAAPVLGAFSISADITGTNAFGATITLRGIVSNSTNAFNNNNLAFS